MKLIDADALIQAMSIHFYTSPYFKHIIDFIDNAPTVEAYPFEQVQELVKLNQQFAQEIENLKRPTGEWIPVSERLPEEEDYRPCYGLPDGCVMWQTDNGDIGFGWYYDSTKCWSDIYDKPIKTGKVIAWMPLPEPYKKGGEENETDNRNNRKQL